MTNNFNPFENTGLSTPPHRPKHHLNKDVAHLEPRFTESNLVDQFRLYDQMIYDWLGAIEYPTKDKQTGETKFPQVPRVFAAPDRAFAKMLDVLQKSRDQRFRNIDNIGNVPLPFISIWRQINEFDSTRYERAVMRKVLYKEDCLEVKQIPYPSPQNIPYQIEFWTRNRTTLNYLQQWISLQFDSNLLHLGVNMREVDINLYPDPIGIRVDKVSMSDTSDLEPGEQSRKMRFTLDILVKGFLFRPSRTVKTVERTIFDTFSIPTDELLDKGDYESKIDPDNSAEGSIELPNDTPSKDSIFIADENC